MFEAATHGKVPTFASPIVQFSAQPRDNRRFPSRWWELEAGASSPAAGRLEPRGNRNAIGVECATP